MFDAEVGELADVAEPVSAGQELHEAAKILNRDNLAAIDLSDFSFGRHALDFLLRFLHAFLGNRVDVHRAIVLNIDLAT